MTVTTPGLPMGACVNAVVLGASVAGSIPAASAAPAPATKPPRPPATPPAAAAAAAAPLLLPADTLSLPALRQQLPAHLFERRTRTSCMYLLHDLALATLFFYLGTQIDRVAARCDVPAVIHAGMWVGYWLAQGIVCTGLWVLAHECGHQAFSPYPVLNHATGLILHSALLVPYHAWRLSHGQHHKHTNHLEKDTVFVPRVAGQAHAHREGPAAVDAPLRDLLGLARMLLGGWPAYLLYNASGGQPRATGRWESHFRPSTFAPRHARQIVLSTACVVLVLALLGLAAARFGPGAVLRLYAVPYLHVNLWLVLITYLQHTSTRVPHFDAASFSFVRGALATVDRDYGALLNHCFHHIGDTHRVHHLFSTMPHYHAVQATKLLRFPCDTTPIFLALWQTYRACREVREHKHHLFWFNVANAD